MSLFDMQETISQYVNMISTMLDVGAFVTDENAEIVASRLLYPHKQPPREKRTLVGQAIELQQPVIVDDRTQHHMCRECPSSNLCTIDGIIIVPIMSDGSAIGAIGIVPGRSKHSMFLDSKSHVQYLENFGKLISQQHNAIRDHEELIDLRHSVEILTSSVDEGLCIIDDEDRIVSYNGIFSGMFGPSRDYKGMDINQLAKSSALRSLIKSSRTGAKSLIVYLENSEKKRIFYGTVLCVPTIEEDIYRGQHVFFKDVQRMEGRVYKVSDPYERISFDTIVANQETGKMFDIAKQLAKTDEPVLLAGEEGIGKTIIARAIHNYSHRSNGYFVTIDCKHLPIFFEGKPISLKHMLSSSNRIDYINLAHKGTLLFDRIEFLPMYLQDQLLQFICTNELMDDSNSNEIKIDVRMIFTCCEPLSDLTQKGMFREKLYKRIAQHTILFPPLREMYDSKREVILLSFEQYKKTEQKEDLEMEPEALDILCDYYWPGNIVQLKIIMARIVAKCEKIVTVADIEEFGINDQERYIKPIKQFEQEQIEKLLAAGKTKEEISKLLNIGRATLYRRIKQYNIKI